MTFDDQDFPDEELLEDDLGPVVARSDDSDASKNGDQSKPNSSKKKSIRNKPGHAGRAAGSEKAGSGSDDSGSLESNKKEKRSPSIDFQADDRQSNADTDASSPNDSSKNNRSRVSDREQRSRRRQQMIEEEVPGTGLLKPAHPRPTGVLPPAHKKTKTKGGEEVVKIPMLTGTLYLYRGTKRRVAFIRKV